MEPLSNNETNNNSFLTILRVRVVIYDCDGGLLLARVSFTLFLCIICISFCIYGNCHFSNVTFYMTVLLELHAMV